MTSSVRLIPLGTSSGVPTRERGVSAFALDYGRGWILLDCGDGTQQKALRAGLNVHALSAVFITHLHGDHVLGLLPLISSLALQRRTRELQIFGPAGIRDLLMTAARLTAMKPLEGLAIHEIGPGLVCEREEFSATAAQLEHRVPTFGYRIDLGSRYGQFSVAYCTDTRPCASSVELARGVDILIHEATYTEMLARQAWERGHSTAAQAASIARAAEVGELLLTHFSPRYPDARVLVEEAARIFPASDAALDLRAIQLEKVIQAQVAS